METDPDVLIKTARERAPIGRYLHWKGQQYDVIEHTIYCTGPQLGALVSYVSFKDGRKWSRTIDDFCGKVEDFTMAQAGNKENFVHRFQLLEKFDHPHALVYATILENKKFWDEQKLINPAFAISGGGASLKYVVGDKIHFAQCMRIITQAEALDLMDQVKKWE
jgi:hypothetical protein